jgi:flagellar FliL protein
MSTAAAAEAPEAAAAPKRSFGKKKLLMLLVIALLVLAIAGGGVLWFLKKRAARLAAEAENGDAPVQVEHKHDAKHAPTFVPLDPFTVNLADREAERYAQIGITLELEDAHAADDIKAYMPAIRSNVLMVLSHKTSQELLEREGKERLAFEIKREASRALGIEIEDEWAAKAAARAASGAGSAPKPAKRKVFEPSPITKVYFSNFIIQ